MNKIDILLKSKKENILSIYFIAGFPELKSTVEIIHELEKNKVDIIEIGIPFSDPIADGQVIQFSNNTAIENGMTLEILFSQLKDIASFSRIPKILMGYFNPVFKFGVERFCEKCREVGIDGVIIPDLPVYEFENQYKSIFQKYGIHTIFLVSPQTAVERLKSIDELTTSFIYAVSTNSTTGGITDFDAQKEYFTRLKALSKRPFLIGFGVRDKRSFDKACEYANGAIIGSAFINALSQTGDLKKNISEFIYQIKL
ncbi:MAG: tryptophan synthase subunit alpha [Bacteroidetes bacterium GWF2_33_16]|nr:MAG: tryptophan synthase subunit alpha [Bacteroidetes bacterium GWE2_32_14]OFY04574.1 MAG: tryptophan synthase subunit alpha [Bacteroidetes bacterium GWF2_33_16]